jgi:hypothetical protein
MDDGTTARSKRWTVHLAELADTDCESVTTIAVTTISVTTVRAR